MNWFGIRERAQRADRQTGSVIVPAAAALLVGLVLLGAAQLGQNFYVKRELQNAADLAALAGAQSLGAGDDLGCQEAQRMAGVSLRSQEGSPAAGLTGDGVQVRCGQWDGTVEDSAQRFTPALPAHSVQVRLSHQAPSLFPFLSPASIDAVATANTSEPVATFSVGSRLLSLKKNGLVYQLLRGVGLSADDLRLLDSDGLVNASITPSGLLKALGLPATVIAGVGTPDELTKLEELTLADLLRASLDLVAQQETLGLDVGVLPEFIRLLLGVGALDVPIQLLGEGGILAVVDGVDPLSALNVKLDVLQLLGTAVVVANGQNLIKLDLSALPLGDLSPINARLQIVEPPSIAVGGVGATANSAGIRLYVKVDVPLIIARIKLNLIVEASQAQARLENICYPPLQSNQAAISATSSLVNVCVGEFKNVADFFSTENSCLAAGFGDVSPLKVIEMPLLGALKVKVAQSIPMILDEDPKVFTAPPSEMAEQTFTAQGINLSKLVKDIVDTVLVGVLGDLLGKDATLSSTPKEERKKIANYLVGDDGAGESISKVVADSTWSNERMEALRNRFISNGLIGALSGTLSVVDGVLKTVVAAPISDFGCLFAGLGGEEKLRQCRVNAVEKLVLSDASLMGTLLNLVLGLLDPVLDLLSKVLYGLLQLLGLDLGSPTVKLHDVQCGTPYLVQ